MWDNDQVGFAVTNVRNSNDYMSSLTTPSKFAETTLEFLYRFEAFPGFSIQPDFQYVIYPSTSGSTPNASVFQLRFDILL